MRSRLQAKTTGISQLDHQRSALLAERDRVLTALQDLDFDNALGKVPVEIYREQRGLLLQTGASVLRRLDEMNVAVNQDNDTEPPRWKNGLKPLLLLAGMRLSIRSGGFHRRCWRTTNVN